MPKKTAPGKVTKKQGAALADHPRQTITRGDGITAREFVVLEPEEHFKRIIENYKKYGSSFEVLIAHVERWARSVIKITDEDGNLPSAPTGDADTPENYAIRIMHNIGIVRALIRERNAVGAAWVAVQLGAIITEAKMKFKWERPALFARPFLLGSQKGRVGPIRKAIAKLLKEDPSAKNGVLWTALSEKPPRGYTFLENRLGKYVEDEKGQTVMEWPRFCNIASEERKTPK